MRRSGWPVAAASTRREQAARETGARFEVDLQGASSADQAALRNELAQADIVLACAAAGVQVVSPEDLAFAMRLKIAADVNAVPPEGIAGVGVMDDSKPLAAAAGAVGIGAFVVGNVKYQTQHRLLVQHVPVREGRGVELPGSVRCGAGVPRRAGRVAPAKPAT